MPKPDVGGSRAMKPTHGVMHVQGIVVEVTRKDVKHVRISIHPPGGEVRVSAPRHVRDAEIARILEARMSWIVRKQAEVAARETQPHLEFVTGEMHAFAGQRYRLVVIEDAGRPAVNLVGDTMEMRVPPGASAGQRAAVLERWYRKQLGERLTPLVSRWSERLGVDVPEVRIRRMKTRWGSCNVRAKRIWLNLELAGRPASSLEYVVVHELAHLIEPGHGPRFWALVERHLPGWRREREALKNSPC